MRRRRVVPPGVRTNRLPPFWFFDALTLLGRKKGDASMADLVNEDDDW